MWIRESCIGCKYWRPVNRSGYFNICHYCIDTGQSRDCDPAHCDKRVMLSEDQIKKIRKELKKRKHNKNIEEDM